MSRFTLLGLNVQLYSYSAISALCFSASQLQHNAKILARDHKNMTPIAHAALHGCYDVMVCLFHYSE